MNVASLKNAKRPKPTLRNIPLVFPRMVPVLGLPAVSVPILICTIAAPIPICTIATAVLKDLLTPTGPILQTLPTLEQGPVLKRPVVLIPAELHEQLPKSLKMITTIIMTRTKIMLLEEAHLAVLRSTSHVL